MMKMSTTQRAAAAAAKAKQVKTCCNCWHIKFGIVILGLIELIAVALILSGIFTQIINKSRKFSCDEKLAFRLFRDCNSLTFDWTLAGDYFIALLLFTIAICVLLLFLGILMKSPFLLLPHLLIQGIFLISSLAYFVLYARSYFYIDLYKQRKTFDLTALLERMWLATLLLILAAFQLYIFFTVIKCCLYLKEYQNERLRRIRQFEECRKRVQNAKQNGLWRYTSWGGSFQQYVGEYDSDNRKLKKRDKPLGHVQWNLQANIELDESKTSFSCPVEASQQLKEITNDEENRLTNIIRNTSTDDNESNYYHNDSDYIIKPSLNKERVNKQFPKVVPVQPVKPIVTTISAAMKAAITTSKEKKSSDDISPEISNITEQQSGNMGKKFSATNNTTFYCNTLKKISVSSTISPPFAPTIHKHSILY